MGCLPAACGFVYENGDYGRRSRLSSSGVLVWGGWDLYQSDGLQFGGDVGGL